MVERFENFTYLIDKLSKTIQKIKVIEMKKLNLKAVHVLCIHHLYQAKDGLTSKDLITLTLEDKAAISRALSYLQEENILEYKKLKHNGKITLTEHGVEVAKLVLEKSELAQDAGGNNLTEEEREVLYRVLNKIDKNLDEYYNMLTLGEK